jgi:hypothetical protein
MRAIGVVSSTVALNVIVFFMDAFVVKGGCKSPKEANKVKRASGNVSNFI